MPPSIKQERAKEWEAPVCPTLADEAGVAPEGPPLQGIGYWNNDGWNDAWGLKPQEPVAFPSVHRLLAAVGPHEPDSRVVAYLRAGHVFRSYRGFSWCRFQGCPVGVDGNGSRCLTDGVWVWPEGLSHYVGEHKVPLPVEFLRTVENNGWAMPAASVVGVYWPLMTPIDYSYWRDWCASVTQR